MAILEETNVTADTQVPRELVLVGRFARAHGLRGEVKVVPEIDEPEHFQELGWIYAGVDPGALAPYKVESVRLQQTKHGATVIVKLEGVENPEGADALRHQLVFARASDLPPVSEDEAYVQDLIGLSVVTEEGEEIGSVSDVLEMPGHHVYVVSRSGKPDAWIPAVQEFIIDVDLDVARIIIRPIEGLLD